MTTLIGFCGAGGVGKTTTAKLLAKELDLPFIESSSRAVFARRGLVEADQHKMTPQEQFALQTEIFESREELEAKIKEGVADRTLFDQTAYAMLRAASVITEKELEDRLSRARLSIIKYTHLFYFPLVTFPTATDGMRETTYGLRVNFDAILRWLLVRADVGVITVPTASVEERVGWIKGVL